MFGCIYIGGFQQDWSTCSGRSGQWPVAFVLASLPLFIRLVQSIKRYTDSGLVTHLINVSAFCFFDTGRSPWNRVENMDLVLSTICSIISGDIKVWRILFSQSHFQQPTPSYFTETHYNPLFALWLICNTVYSTYATSWVIHTWVQ